MTQTDPRTTSDESVAAAADADVYLEVTDGGVARLNSRVLIVPAGTDPTDRLLEEAAAIAATLGRPVTAYASGPDGAFAFSVGPDRQVSSRSLQPRPPDPQDQPATTAVPAPDQEAEPGRVQLEDVDREGEGHRREAPANRPAGEERRPAVDKPDDHRPPGREPDPHDVAVRVPGTAHRDGLVGASEEHHAETGLHILASPPRPASAVAGLDDQPQITDAGQGAPAWAMTSAVSSSVPWPEEHRSGWPPIRSDPPRRGQPRSGQSRSWRIHWRPILAVVVTAILGVALIAWIAPRQGIPEPPTPATSEPVSTPGDAEAPRSPVTLAAAPPGYDSRPRWSQMINSRTKVAVADDVIMARDGDGHLIRLDPATGRVLWKTDNQWDQAWQGPSIGRVDGQRVIGFQSPTELSLLSIPATGDAPTGAPITIALPTDARVTWRNDSSPMIKSDLSVAVIHAGAMQPITLPPAAVNGALAADGQDVVVARDGSWTRVGVGREPQSHPYPTLPGVSGAARRAVDVDGRYLLFAWPAFAAGQTIALLDTRTGQVVLSSQLPAGIDITQAPILRQMSGPITSIGPVVVDTTARRVSAIQAQYTPVTITPGHVYASTSGGSRVDIRLTTGGFTVVPLAPHAPIPVTTLPGSRLALAVLQVQNRSWLVALPSTQTVIS
jgi:hypothetical protein